MKTAGILLAAGNSSRLGQPKQLLTIAGETLIRRAARVLLEGGCASVFVILGAFEEECRQALSGLPVEIVCNKKWREGMGTSVAIGIATLSAKIPNADAAIISVCDQPYLDAGLIEALVSEGRSGGCSIVASDYGENLGPPALFGATHFHELTGLQGETGARQLIQIYASSTARVSFPQGHVDIDGSGDLAALHRPPASMSGAGSLSPGSGSGSKNPISS